MASRKREIETLWGVIRLRSKGEYRGRVEAKDKETARKAARKEFKLAPFDEPRLLVRECQ
jgi:hypothetical protein